MTLGSQRGMKIAGRAAQRRFNNLRLFWGAIYSRNVHDLCR